MRPMRMFSMGKVERWLGTVMNIFNELAHYTPRQAWLMTGRKWTAGTGTKTGSPSIPMTLPRCPAPSYALFVKATALFGKSERSPRRGQKRPPRRL